MAVYESICRKINDRDALDQLQEECAELIQAASKCIRVIKGDKNVDPRKARESFIEELADVFATGTVVGSKLLDEDEQARVEILIHRKALRWLERLSAAEQEDKT